MATILLVEDYPSLQKIYRTVLEKEGHTVVVASDGNEGLVEATKHKIDLILLDLLMPNADGFTFLETYKLAEHPTVKLIVLTNAYTPELLNRAMQLGVNNYLLKTDITPEKMVTMVTETLEPAKA
ncbi:MAG TPA: response regulator [Candidatus Saccharimonadales bacterium]|nr:response regulator [Candidatus Saccharimonadales bacterium]